MRRIRNPVYRFFGTVGSNPTLSANNIKKIKALRYAVPFFLSVWFAKHVALVTNLCP